MKLTRLLKSALIAVSMLVISVVALHAAGLGSTQQDFETEWYRGYKKIFPFADMGQNIHIGAASDIYLSYITGDAGHSFGNPPRIGMIQGPGCGVIMDNSLPPEAILFFEDVKKLLPPKSRLVAAYKIRHPFLTEKYVFKSAWLSRLPGISQVNPYQSFMGIKGEPVGTFQLIVNYNIKDSRLVENFTLALGRDDMEGMKRISKNPFR